jgi:sugar O-acyltransferase (sialic acid O-acetyltransferase NeuD family)
MALKRLAIIGAGDLGQQIAHHAEATSQFSIAGYFDDFQAVATVVGAHPVLGKLDAIEDAHRRGMFDQLLLGIGYKHLALRHAIYQRLHDRVPFARLVHPAAWVDPSAIVEPGVIIYPGCVIDQCTRIGANTLLNLGCVLAHHGQIGRSCFFGPGVRLAGFVNVGERCLLGIGSVVIDNVTLAADVRTGGGAVVTGNLGQAGLYVGVPARLIKGESCL